MVHWLRHHDFTAEGPSSIPGQGTKISQATWDNQKKKKRKMENKNCKYEGDNVHYGQEQDIPEYKVDQEKD